MKYIVLATSALALACSTSPQSHQGKFQERLLATIPEHIETRWHRFSRDGSVVAYIAKGADKMDRVVVGKRVGEPFELV